MARFEVVGRGVLGLVALAVTSAERVAAISLSAVVWCLVSLMAIMVGGAALAGETAVAVSANFLEPMKAVQEDFARSTGHRIKLSSGSTGELYTQIVNGAPFDVFLSADQARPEALEASGQAIAGSRFTYAIGRLVLWSADAETINPDGPTVLKAGAFRQIAIANPKTAPYGAAALQVMRALGLYEALEPKIVQGQSLSQAYQFVAQGSAELGFVAFSQVRASAGGGAWPVPQELYEPIRQDAVLLTRGKDNEAAVAFLSYLKSAGARRLIEDAGYSVSP